MILITAGEETIRFFEQLNRQDGELVHKEEEMAILNTGMKLSF